MHDVMIHFEEAYRIVTESAPLQETETIDFELSPGRVLAADIMADMAMPPFDKSAVDGYACRRDDIDGELEMVEVIPAGKAPKTSLKKGQCAKIMTGAMVPQGANMVLMVEHTEETASGRIRFVAPKSSNNICYRAEDINQGDVVLTKGTLVKPPQIAVMASVGCVNPLVYKQPRVGIISTGDELVEPHKKPQASQIRNSNASQLVAQVKRAGCIPSYQGIALDTAESTRKTIQKALQENDVIILTGGVSMGDFDYVPQILKEEGIEIRFKSLAVQPGRPTVFGVKGEQMFFGLPGNPVSSFVQFELLVKPLLYKMRGHDFKSVILKMPMGNPYQRRKSERKSFIPVQFTPDGKVVTVAYHGSAHIHSYIHADGLVAVEIGKTELREGEIVDVRQI